MVSIESGILSAACWRYRLMFSFERFLPCSGKADVLRHWRPRPVHMLPTTCGGLSNMFDAVMAEVHTSWWISKASRSHFRSSMGSWPIREKVVSLG